MNCIPAAVEKPEPKLIAVVPPLLDTTNVAVPVWVRDPLVALTVTVYTPVGVVLPVVTVSLDEPFPPLIVVGLNVPVVPVGRPLTLSDVVPVNPFNGEIIAV